MPAQEADVTEGQEQAMGTGGIPSFSNVKGFETNNRAKLHSLGKGMVLKGYERCL